ncbi:MAG: hypothetical protein JW854_13550 [Actinobacteria bacterium]|nr:hypothetical protein [Actinomycetota bacterium]
MKKPLDMVNGGEWLVMKIMRPATKRSGASVLGTGAGAGNTEGEGGFALIFVIFTIMVVGILGAMVLLYTAYALRSAEGVTPSSRAQTTAEAGLDTVHAMLAAGDIDDSTPPETPITGTMWDGKGQFSVSVVKDPKTGDGDPYDWLVTSQGEYTAEIEGVDRTFYRTLEEVITFAGGRYYSALDYVLFSKEGSIDINLLGDLDVADVGGILIDGNVYAGQDIVLDNAAKLMAGTEFELQGDVVTEYGDIVAVERNVAFASSNFRILGDMYSGILTGPGDVGGGVKLESRLMFLNGGNIEVVGDINSYGRLRDYDLGVRLYNHVGVLGNCNTHISGTIRSNHDVYAENDAIVAGSPTMDIDGTIYCGEDVEITSDLFFGGNLRHDINGSIYAAGDIDLYAEGTVLGLLYNRVGGDIQAGGDVNISHQFSIGCVSPSGYVVAGDIYGNNVTMYSRLGAAGTLANSVGGNIYADGWIDLDNISGAFATSRVNVGGSAYSRGRMDIYAQDGFISSAPVKVSGAVLGLDPPGTGLFSLGNMSLEESGSTDITITGDARDNTADGPTIGGTVDISGAKTPALSQLAVPSAGEPEPPTAYVEVLLPKCDFDYYRELAKQQEDTDGQDHYREASVPDFDLGAGAYSSSLYVIFVEGDLGIGTVDIPVDCKAVMVATGNVTLQEELRRQGAGDAEFQIIAGGKVTYDTNFNVALDDSDSFFIYAADEYYDPVTSPISVEYEMGWFRNLNGQITARGDIQINSYEDAFKWGPHEYSIHYKNPSVLGEAFRIPFTVKSWKEK